MIVASLGQIALCRDAEPRAKRLQQDRHQIRKQNDAEKRVAESRATRQIRRPVPRIHVTDRDQIAGTGESEQLSPKTRARRDQNRAVRFRQARRCAIDSPSASARNLIMHRPQVSVSFAADKIDNGARGSEAT